MDMLTLGDVARGSTNRPTVLTDGRAGADRHRGKLVSSRYRRLCNQCFRSGADRFARLQVAQSHQHVIPGMHPQHVKFV